MNTNPHSRVPTSSHVRVESGANCNSKRTLNPEGYVHQAHTGEMVRYPQTFGHLACSLVFFFFLLNIERVLPKKKKKRMFNHYAALTLPVALRAPVSLYFTSCQAKLKYLKS